MPITTPTGRAFRTVSRKAGSGGVGGRCRSWLRRGRLLFFNRHGVRLGTRRELIADVASASGIEASVLGDLNVPRQSMPFEHLSIAKRMSWASRRVMTRLEDRAYCLLGIFNVNMLLLYGEGEKAFIRLQEEIIKVSDDQSIFAWNASSDLSRTGGLLAFSPFHFRDTSAIVPFRGSGLPHEATNKGIRIQLPVWKENSTLCRAILNCRLQDQECPLALQLVITRATHHDFYARVLSRDPVTITVVQWAQG
jgi:hypothetical protein